MTDPATFKQASFTLETLDVLFPMHVILSAEGNITRVGPALRKILGDDLVDKAFLDAFTLKKPRSIVDLDGLRDAAQTKVVICAPWNDGESIEFRCVPNRFGPDERGLFIDFSLSSSFLDVVNRFGLNASDFKPNDVSLDLIYTIEPQRTLVEDSNRLTRALEDSRLEAERAANVDVLTGISNRRSLYRHIDQLLAAPVLSEEYFLLHIDLDKFKAVNDNFGHAAGDHVLQQTASVLQRVAKSNDIPARIGGDEFAMLIAGPYDDVEIVRFAADLQTALVAPIQFEGHVFNIGASVGIVRVDVQAHANADELLKCSDIALYEAKVANESVTFLTSAMLERHTVQTQLIKEIEAGLKASEFVPFFQPKVNTRKMQINGVEVLARWQHPTRGLLPPSEFLDTARSAKLMGAIERQIMRKAIRAYKDWSVEGLAVGRLSFNLTATNLRSVTFVQLLETELRLVGLDPSVIELELLESVLFERSDPVVFERCQALRDAGFHLALDDFGTGHASLSFLIDNPISTIKIDRSFISGINREPRLQRITRSILALAKQLDLEVVAEGVETRKELEVLNAFGCHQVQGYLFCKPTNAEIAGKWFRAWIELMLGTTPPAKKRA